MFFPAKKSACHRRSERQIAPRKHRLKKQTTLPIVRRRLGRQHHPQQLPNRKMINHNGGRIRQTAPKKSPQRGRRAEKLPRYRAETARKPPSTPNNSHSGKRQIITIALKCKRLAIVGRTAIFKINFRKKLSGALALNFDT